MQSAIRLGKISHAYIIYGEAGFSKKLLAEAFAQALLCSKLNPDYDKNQVSFPGLEVEEPKLPEVIEPCCECAICQGITKGTISDVVEIDAASNNGADDIRALRSTVKFLPSQGKYKVYIIDEVHMLSEAAFNALLKTLEEPPAHVIFILATTEPYKFQIPFYLDVKDLIFNRFRLMIY